MGPPRSLRCRGWERGWGRGCHKNTHPPLFFFYYGIHSLMFGGYPPTAIGYPPTAIGYTPTAIVGRIGHSEFFFFHYGTPWGGAPAAAMDMQSGAASMRAATAR